MPRCFHYGDESLADVLEMPGMGYEVLVFQLQVWADPGLHGSSSSLQVSNSLWCI